MNLLTYQKEFWEKGVTFLPSLVDRSLISSTKLYLDDHESSIISKYSRDKRRMVIEEVHGSRFIKYFELPLSENFQLFGQFISNTTLSIVSTIMKEDVNLVSLEVHSRNPGGSHIPLHQDNAYYGLVHANACTLFIPLTVSYMGNLRYISNSPESFYEHEKSNADAFSLQIAQTKLKKRELVGREVIEKHQLGGAFLHHSHSVHFANNVPKNASRVWAIRLTFFGTNTLLKEGHLKWYNEVVSDNRSHARL